VLRCCTAMRHFEALGNAAMQCCKAHLRAAGFREV
jgi:hypothetical protein